LEFDDRKVAQGIAVGRIGLGVAAMARPQQVGALMFGPGARDPEPVMLARMAGARDLAIGVATLAALNRGLSAGTAVALAAACDVVDAAASVGRGLSSRTRVLTALAAIPTAVVGLRAARTLRNPNSRSAA
jgi:hypothetical protein